MGKLTIALSLLIAGDPLPERYGDHPLSGNWKGFRDMHLEPDWLLLYRIENDELQLARTGTHADLFDESSPANRDRADDAHAQAPTLPEVVGSGPTMTGVAGQITPPAPHKPAHSPPAASVAAAPPAPGP